MKNYITEQEFMKELKSIRLKQKLKLELLKNQHQAKLSVESDIKYIDTIIKDRCNKIAIINIIDNIKCDKLRECLVNNSRRTPTGNRCKY